MTTTTEAPDKMLDRVRKLLAKAEAEGVTPPEAQALTLKAAELMARYGITRALLAATGQQEDKPGNRMFDLADPHARVKGVMLFGIAGAMRCQAIQLSNRAGLKEQVYGFESDLERVDVLYTSLLIQMSHGLAVADVPWQVRQRNQTRSWNRSWLLGFANAVTARVKAAEERAATESQEEHHGQDGGVSTALVLADRSLIVGTAIKADHPDMRSIKIRATGTGYGAGHEKGQRADLGRGRVGGSQRALG